MNYKKYIFILCTLKFLSGCDYIPALDEIIPDRRDDYQRSEALPDLEVPPDLTTEALEDPLVIPDEEATTLSEFERRKRRQSGAQGFDVTGTAGYPGELWLTLQGSNTEIWPMLNEYWANKGYSLDLNDAELGVLETDWLQANGDGITVYRNKFKIFTEEGSAPNSTVLFLSSERQEKIISDDGSESWVEIERNNELEQAIVGELNLHFYGNVVSSAAAQGTSTNTARPTSAKPKRKRVELLKLDDEKSYLSLPEEFSRAWVQTEDALGKAGLFVENQDKDKGLYYIVYYPDPEEDEEGLLSKLKFWGDDEDDGEEYQVSLTGVGDKTELVILDNEGNWAEYQRAIRILTLLQAQYNNAYR